MRGKGMPQAVAIGSLDDSRCIHCALQRALQNSFGHVMPLSFSRARINRKARGGKHILPGPLTCRLEELPADGKRQVHTPESIFEILLVLRFDSHEMSLQRFGQV